MTDLEITKLCAEAVGKDWAEEVAYRKRMDGEWRTLGTRPDYDPLHDDAQAMALDSILIEENYSIAFHAEWFARYEYPSGLHTFEFYGDMTKPENRRRARCECVAKMRVAKSTTTTP